MIGPGHPLVVIAGPCVLEGPDLSTRIVETVAPACEEHGLRFVYKASFDKANRSSIASPRGPGLRKGLDELARVSSKYGLPVTTDVHEPAQCGPAAEVVSILQIPAFLARQTDLLSAAGEAAAANGRAVNAKKGQFLSPYEMRGVVRKLTEAGARDLILTERGTFFGYHRLVNDFIGLGDMMELDAGVGARPAVCFDCTHSTQLPGAGETSGGRPERAPLLARAAVAAGVDAVFLECHPDPARAASDASTVLPLETLPALLASLAAVRRALEPSPAVAGR